METLELNAKISLVAHLLGGEREISHENIDRLCSMREGYGITGKHPGFKHYREREMTTSASLPTTGVRKNDCINESTRKERSLC